MVLLVLSCLEEKIKTFFAQYLAVLIYRGNDSGMLLLVEKGVIIQLPRAEERRVKYLFLKCLEGLLEIPTHYSTVHHSINIGFALFALGLPFTILGVLKKANRIGFYVYKTV